MKDWYEEWLEELKDRNNGKTINNKRKCECGSDENCAPRQHSEWCPCFHPEPVFENDSCRNGGKCTDCPWQCSKRDSRFLPGEEDE